MDMVHDHDGRDRWAHTGTDIQTFGELGMIGEKHTLPLVNWFDLCASADGEQCVEIRSFL